VADADVVENENVAAKRAPATNSVLNFILSSLSQTIADDTLNDTSAATKRRKLRRLIQARANLRDSKAVSAPA
jgi:hypothetical protein